MADTLLEPEVAGIVFSAGEPVVTRKNILVIDSTSLQFQLSGGSPRVGSATIPTGAAFALSGGAVAVGTAVVPTSVEISVSGGAATIGSLVTATNAAVSFAGSTPTIGNGPTVAVGEITFAGGSLSVGDGFLPEAAVLALSGGSPQIGSGLTLTAGEFAFAGGTAVVATGVIPGFATLWFSGGVMPETTEAAQGTVVVLNANTLAATEYNIAALDVLEHEGEVYFVTTTGLVKLAAEGAEKFSWSFSTGELGLVEGSFGAITKLSLSGKFAGEVRLTVVAQEYGEETEVFYSMPCESTTVGRGQHIALARDVHAEAWTFRFAGTEAAELDDVKVLVSAQTRAW